MNSKPISRQIDRSLLINIRTALVLPSTLGPLYDDPIMRAIRSPELSDQLEKHSTALTSSDIRYIKGIKILHLNTRSLYNTLVEISLLVVESNPDILGISETWLHNGIDDSEIHIPNFSLLRKDRGDGHSGVALCQQQIKCRSN